MSRLFGLAIISLELAIVSLAQNPVPQEMRSTQCCDRVATAFAPAGLRIIDELTFAGPEVQNAANYPGSDPGLRIAACIAALPATGGTCDDRSDTATASSVSPMIKSTTTPKPNVTILLPAAAWTVSDSLVKQAGCWDNLSIIGEGEKTSITTNAPRTLIGFPECKVGMSRLHISGISYDDTATSSASLGFFAYIWNCTDCEVDNNWIAHGGQGGIFVVSSSSSVYSNHIHVHHNQVTATYGSNLAFSTYTQEVEVDHNVCSQTHRNCIDTNGRLNNIHDNAVDTIIGTDKSDRYGILIYQNPGLGLSDGNEIRNNTVRRTDFSCIKVDVTDPGAGDNIRVVGNTCESADGAALGHAGLAATSNSIGRSGNVEFSGNTVVDVASNGIEVDGFQKATISGNVVNSPGKSCYQFNDSQSYHVTDNICRDPRSSGKGHFGGYLFFASGAGLVFTNNTEEHTRTSPSFGLSFQPTRGKICGTVAQTDQIHGSVEKASKCP